MTSRSIEVARRLTFGPRLKLQRAEEFIHEIEGQSSAMPWDWFQIKMLGPDAILNGERLGCYGMVYLPCKPVPELFALRIGDAAHNLRASLDHLANGIFREVAARTGEDAARSYFPVSSNRDDVSSHAGMKTLEKALPGSRALILDELRPTNNPKDYLWSFGSLESGLTTNR